MRLWLLLGFLFQQGMLGTSQSKEGTLFNNLKQDIKTVGSSAIGTLNSHLLPVTNAVLPECVEPLIECPNPNVTFWLYTRGKDKVPIQLSLMDTESLKSLGEKVKTSNPWKMIIHGYSRSRTELPNTQLREAYFKTGNWNMLSVDYAPLARKICYISSVKNTPLVAKCTAQMIDHLVQNQFFTLDDLHIIGFSLGAQIAGRIYEFLKSGKPGRITALDPASPLFDGVANTQISRKSAKFVDVIHTNAYLRGQVSSLGHIDFYPNGGSIQPGCILSSCHHERAAVYFAESINSKSGFWGIPCTSYMNFLSGKCNSHEKALVLMGESVYKNNTGIFYLQTKPKSPYAQGKVTQPFQPS